MKKIGLILTFLFLILMNISAGEILPVYSQVARPHFQDLNFNGNNTVGAIISRINITTTGTFDETLYLKLSQDTSDEPRCTIKVYHNKPNPTENDQPTQTLSSAQIGYKVYLNDGYVSHGNLWHSSEDCLSLGVNLEGLVNPTIRIDFIVLIPWGSYLFTEDPVTTTRIIDLPTIGINLYSSGVAGTTKENVSTLVQISNSDDSVPVFGPGASDPEAVIENVPYGDQPVVEPEPEPTPNIRIDAVDNPNINTSSRVKIADIYGYWSKDPALMNVYVNIKPQSGTSFLLRRTTTPVETIAYNVFYDNIQVSGEGSTFERELLATNLSTLEKKIGELEAILAITQATLGAKPAGTYTDTIVITISLDQ